MENLTEEKIKISINYSENTQAWNNFVNLIISFMIDSNLLGDDVFES